MGMVSNNQIFRLRMIINDLIQYCYCYYYHYYYHYRYHYHQWDLGLVVIAK